MNRSVDIKSAAIGAVLVAFLLLAAGMVASDSDAPVIGRFQIACTNTLGFLVDTATGQVWVTGDPDFRAPKLQGTPAALPDETNDFVGQWIADDPDGEDTGLEIEPDGTAIATDGFSRYEGRWHIFGTRIVITIDGDVLTGELQPSGRLLLNVAGSEDDPIVLRRAQ